MRRSYKYLMLALVIGNAQAAQRELFNARETLERAKVGTYSPRAQPPVRVDRRAAGPCCRCVVVAARWRPASRRRARTGADRRGAAVARDHRMG